ncbi:hypothetical protein Tco_1032421 [Tanacetum coccineum]|uniref:Uncharacterized protein n=1 Tax=Tanacetum coccineum TaxID=301880 RepID=A0ABQ5GCD3_9ASTR
MVIHHLASDSSQTLPYIFTYSCEIWLRARPLLLTISHANIILSQIEQITPIRADRPEVTLPPQKRLGIALGLRYKVGESSSASTARPPGGFRADYGFVTTMDMEIMRDLERDIGYGITNTWDEMLDTYEIYTRLDDEQTERHLMAGRLNMLYRDRRVHARTTLLMEREDRMSREAWG